MDSKKFVLIVFALVLLAGNAFALLNCEVQDSLPGKEAVYCDGIKITQDVDVAVIQLCGTWPNIFSPYGIYMCKGGWSYMTSGPGKNSRVSGFYVSESGYAVWAFANDEKAALYSRKLDGSGTPRQLTQDVAQVYGVEGIVYSSKSTRTFESSLAWLSPRATLTLGTPPSTVVYAYIVGDKLIYAHRTGSWAAYYVNTISDPTGPTQISAAVADRLYDIQGIVYETQYLNTMATRVDAVGYQPRWHSVMYSPPWNNLSGVYIVDDTFFYMYFSQTEDIGAGYYVNSISDPYTSYHMTCVFRGECFTSPGARITPKNYEDNEIHYVGRVWTMEYIINDLHEINLLGGSLSGLSTSADTISYSVPDTVVFAGLINETFIFGRSTTTNVNFYKSSINCPGGGSISKIVPHDDLLQIYHNVSDPSPTGTCMSEYKTVTSFWPQLEEFAYGLCYNSVRSRGTDDLEVVCPVGGEYNGGGNGDGGGDPEPDCTEGVCCTGKYYKPIGTRCGTETQTVCSGNGCGNDVIEQKRTITCTGASETCPSDGTEEWTTFGSTTNCKPWQTCNGGSCATDAICPTSIIDINALTPIYLGDNAVIDVNVSQARTVTLKIMNPLTRKVLDEFISPSNIYFSYTGFKPETIGTYKAIATIEDTVANPCDICSAEVFFTVVKSGQSMAVPETDIVLVAIVGLLVVAIARLKRN